VCVCLDVPPSHHGCPVFTRSVYSQDKAINAISDGQNPGSVLMRLAFGTHDEAEKSDWGAAVEEAEARSPAQLRVHVYQARELPAADEDGALDPCVM
jgi:hypothetical protein